MLINSFTSEEIERFRKFILSPYYNKGRKYMPFLDEVLKFRSLNEIKSIKSKSFKISKPGNLSEQTLRNRFSELYKLGEEFLICEGMAGNKIEKKKILLRKLLNKKLHKAFNIKYKETLSHLTNNKFEFKVFQDLSQLKEIHIEYFNERNKVENLYTEYFDNSKIMLCLNLLTFLEVGIEFLLQESDNRKYTPNYLSAFLKDLNISDMMIEFKNSETFILKITAMIYNLYKAFEENKAEYYKESHKIFAELGPKLTENYKIKIFYIMTNFCIIKLNEGNPEYVNELFKLYNEKLDQNLISDIKNKVYIFNNFRDYVFIGLSVKNFKWVEKFIEDYSGILPIEIRKDETYLSYGKLYFERKKYARSLEFLSEVKASHYLQYIDASLFKLFNFYELHKYEEALLEVDKLKHYYSNHKEIPAGHYLKSINFIKIFRKLIRIKTNPGHSDSGLLEKELMDLKFVAKKEWLREKIVELNS